MAGCAVDREGADDGRGSRDGATLPLGAEGIDARAAERHTDPAAGAFRETLRLRLDISWLAMEAAQAAMLQFGARGYLEGSEPFRRLREAQFVAIVTPSVKHITRELAGRMTAACRRAVLDRCGRMIVSIRSVEVPGEKKPRYAPNRSTM